MNGLQLKANVKEDFKKFHNLDVNEVPVAFLIIIIFLVVFKPL